MDTTDVREIHEHLSLTNREEKLFKQIVFHEPKGPLDRFLRSSTKGAIGKFKALITLVGVSFVVAVIYMVERALEPRLDRITPYANVLFVVAILLQAVQITARERLIRKIYHAQDRKPS